MDERTSKIRWRLILGNEAESTCGSLGAEDQQRDAALEFLYGREGKGKNRRGDKDSGGPGGKDKADGDMDKGVGSGGTLDPSNLSVPDWINAVHTLFPKRTIERIEKDALERYDLQELVTNPDLLKRAEPNMTLLKAVMQTKHLMNQEVLTLARDLVRRVVEELMKKLAKPIESVFLGAANRRRRSLMRVSKNFDAPTTIRRNLQHYDLDKKKLFIRTPHFFSRLRRLTDKWQIIIVVDESGSMVKSVIHSAVTAAIFFGIKALKTHLVLFDTSIVDMSADCGDPVETIMKVQLGGGTDIGQAMCYAESLIENPRKAIIVLVTDFEEGAPVHNLYSCCKRVIEQGTFLLGLAALDADAEPRYNRNIAGVIAGMGAHIGAMTPGELAEFVAEKIK